MAGFTIERATVPTTLDVAPDDPAAPVVADFVAGVNVRRATEIRGYGTDEVVGTAEEVFPNWLDRHQPKELWLAKLDGVVVGRGVHESQLGDEGADVAWVDVHVHPDAEGLGIGTALAEAIETHARGVGKTRLLTYSVHPDGPGPRLESPTGFGSIAAENREVRFLQARGYRLEQLERGSRFALPPDRDALTVYLDAAQQVAGADYRVHTWHGVTPERWRADIAVLRTRMSTDAPSAGLEEPEDIWTVDRVIDRDALDAAGASPTVTAAVEHVPSGTLVGYTQLDVPRATSHAINQGDTLVLREHRGHRLGMLLKAANLLYLDEVDPGHPSVLTWNAEENRYMLGVNEAVGFVPIGYEGAWRLDL